MEKKVKKAFLQGSRVFLRPLELEDAPVLLEGMNDLSVRQYLSRIQPLTLEDEEKWIAKTHEEYRTGKAFTFAVCLIETNELIGTMSIGSISSDHATTGTTIYPAYQNNGYATEAKMLLLYYAFEFLNVRLVRSSVWSINPRSKRYSEKCGYAHVCTEPNKKWIKGEYRDEWILHCTRNSWLEKWEIYKEKYLPDFNL